MKSHEHTNIRIAQDCFIAHKIKLYSDEKLFNRYMFSVFLQLFLGSTANNYRNHKR